MNKIESLALRLQRRAIDGLPNEVCGYLTWDLEVLQLPNVAAQPETNFQMYHEDVLRIWSERAGQISAVWHSHPAGSEKWSVRDMRFWVPNLYNVLVVCGGGILVADGRGAALSIDVLGARAAG